MTRLSSSFLRKLQAPFRKLWDAWSKLQTSEDERWRNSVRGRHTSHKGLVDTSECDVATETPSLLAGHKERPLGTTRAPEESWIESENESAPGSVPTLSELVVRRQLENKLAGAKSLSKGAADE